MVKKRSKKVRFNRNLNFTIFSLIKEGKNPSQICSILNYSKSALSYHLRHLKANGYIQKIGYGVWKTSKNYEFNTLTKTSSNNIRSHAFIFTISLPKISNWEKRELFLKKHKIQYQTFKNRNQQKLTFKGYKIQLSDKSIVVYFNKWKSYFVESARTGENYALYDLQQLLTSLEQLFNVSFKRGKEYSFKVGRRHHALINSELAKMFNRQHKKLFVRDDNGVLRVLIDNSVIDNFGMNEEEAVSQEHAVQDVGVIQKDIKEKIETGWTTKTTIETVGEIAKQSLITQNQLNGFIRESGNYALEIAKHRQAIEKMNLMLDELREEIKSGNKTNKP